MDYDWGFNNKSNKKSNEKDCNAQDMWSNNKNIWSDSNKDYDNKFGNNGFHMNENGEWEDESNDKGKFNMNTSNEEGEGNDWSMNDNNMNIQNNNKINGKAGNRNRQKLLNGNQQLNSRVNHRMKKQENSNLEMFGDDVIAPDEVENDPWMDTSNINEMVDNEGENNFDNNNNNNNNNNQNMDLDMNLQDMDLENSNHKKNGIKIKHYYAAGSYKKYIAHYNKHIYKHGYNLKFPDLQEFIKLTPEQQEQVTQMMCRIIAAFGNKQ